MEGCKGNVRMLPLQAKFTFTFVSLKNIKKFFKKVVDNLKIICYYNTRACESADEFRKKQKIN